ncbi:MAG: DUF2723 domain-containing protein [Bacteroidia bacterium]|nr:DUF2723 domain-containing protein [Bacteroidia bacterium]
MMNYKNLNNITGWAVFAFGLIVYLLTMAPTASFWDCGEFISCANELEVPHPPGAPFFLLLGRVFAMFASGPEKVAFMVNLLSVLASAFTILFTFWIVTTLAKKIVIGNKDAEPDFNQTIAILVSGVVGALACGFAESIWFNAVEAEVYAMSSFFTAIVIWAMLKWEGRADEPDNTRWLVLIAYLMGLSIGVHLLNLLTIPALAFIYYFRKYPATITGALITFGISVVILAVVQFGIILVTFDIAWALERFLVGTISGTVKTGLGMPMGSGIAVTLLLLVAGVVGAIWYSHKENKPVLNVIAMSVVVIYLGLAAYAMIPIRSAANPPIDENDPEKVHSFLSYMKREQYGDFPIFSGTLYNIPYDQEHIIDEIKTPEYVVSEKEGRYKEIGKKRKYEFAPQYKKLFPRMWDRSRYESGPHGYINYVKNKGNSKSPYDDKPTGMEDLTFLWKYQIVHMYWRYFMWNFAGKEGDIQDCAWESGLDFSKASKMPESMKNDPAKNHYFLLPFILGLLGMFWQAKKDRNNAIVVGLLFFFTGFAIILYLNQPPMQPRERDYAFAGSFQTFAIWIGLGVIALYQLLEKYLKGSSAYVSSVVGLLIPGIMLSQNYDDHSRAGNYTCPDSAYNLLNSLAPNAVLFTNGDNDTFPLWYAQEVEGVRPDVRVLCLSYVNTDWYINHMKLKMNESEPLPITLKDKDYVGTEKQAKFFNSSSIEKSFAVNKSQLLADKIVTEEELPYIADTMKWKINMRKEGGGNLLQLADVLLINLIENVAKDGWKRPVYFANTVSPSSFVGLDSYLRQEGLAYRVTPVKKSDDVDYYDSFKGSIREDLMYENLTKKFKYTNLDNSEMYYDENVRRMMGNYYNTFCRLAKYYIDRADKLNAKDSTGRPLVIAKEGETPESLRAKAKEVLAFTEQKLPYKVIKPDEYLLVKVGMLYDKLGEKEKTEEYFSTSMKWCKETLDYYSSTKQYYGKEDNSLAAVSVLMNYYNQTKQQDKMKPLEADFGPYLEKQYRNR